jgi:pilus assembly protein CpaB
MATIGQTLFRFTGALLLGASATSIDQPELLFAPVLSQRITTVPAVAKGTGAGLTVKITPGKRAYGIRVNDLASLAGMVQPNSRVDIMVVISDPEHGRHVAKLFMENMRVLAIGAAPERAQDGRPINAAVASIEVTPTEAEHLAIAASQGSLQLVLRGYGDADSIVVQQLAPAPPLLWRRDPCAPVNPGRAIVRDLLNRGCRVDELRFKKDSGVVRVVPPR